MLDHHLAGEVTANGITHEGRNGESESNRMRQRGFVARQHEPPCRSGHSQPCLAWAAETGADKAQPERTRDRHGQVRHPFKAPMSTHLFNDDDPDDRSSPLADAVNDEAGVSYSGRPRMSAITEDGSGADYHSSWDRPICRKSIRRRLHARMPTMSSGEIGEPLHYVANWRHQGTDRMRRPNASLNAMPRYRSRINEPLTRSCLALSDGNEGGAHAPPNSQTGMPSFLALSRKLC